MQDCETPTEAGNVEGIDFETLEIQLQVCANPQSLTRTERLNILGHAAVTLNNAIAHGIADEAKAKRSVAEWLTAHGLERSIRSLERDLVRFRKEGLLSDARAEANKLKRAPVLSQADRDSLVRWAIQPIGTNIDGGWVKCVKEKLINQELIDRYHQPKNHRPKCPKRIRSQIEAEVARLYPHRLGPRHARLMGASIRRDWSAVPSGAMYSSDDHTPDVYYYIPDGQGWFSMIRGQFLPLIDVRSKKILDFILIDAPTYTAFAIKSLLKRGGMRFGLPDTWYFECGLWKRSKVLGWNGRGRGYSLPEIEQNFAERVGTRIIHALPGNAKAKVIENVFSVLVRYMAGEPGYVGNDEMHVKFEHVRAAIANVQKGPLNGTHPAELGFRSGDEWKSRLETICTEYNKTPQESRVMGGDRVEYLCPEDAWLKYRQRDASGAIVEPVILPKDLEHMLGEHLEEVTVTKNGISLFGGKYRYHSPELANCVGERMVASLDTDDPSGIVVQDIKGQRCFGVPLLPDTPALADPETLSLDLKRISAINRVAKVRHSQLESNWLPKGRPVIVDAQAHETARNKTVAMKAARAQFKRNLDPKPISRLASEDPSLAEFLPEAGRGNSIREVQNFLGGES